MSDPREGTAGCEITEEDGTLRHAVIGIGAGVMAAHRPALVQRGVELVAGSDVNAARGRERAEELGCAFYEDHRAMLEKERPQVAVILAPHPVHARLAADCFQAGCHVLVEKPMAVRVTEADAMISAARRARRLLAVSFQQRHRPEVRAARSLLRGGHLGEVRRVENTVIWPRTAAYYAEAPWRGAPTDEGGGVLMNQAPHDLDLLCHLFGMPSRVFARARTTLHDIEAEDTLQALLEWPGGALGSLYVGTAIAGVEPRLEATGTGGSLRMGAGSLVFERLERDMKDHVLGASDGYEAPASREETVYLEAGTGNHAAVYRNLHAAIRGDETLVCDGEEGRMSLELANALILSSRTREEVELPLDRDRYAAVIAEEGGRRVEADARTGLP
jgi:predicted dehydrogenase